MHLNTVYDCMFMTWSLNKDLLAFFKIFQFQNNLTYVCTNSSEWNNSIILYASQYYKSFIPIYLCILLTSAAKIAGKTGTYSSVVTGHFSTPFPNNLPNQTYCLFSCCQTKTNKQKLRQISRNCGRWYFTKNIFIFRVNHEYFNSDLIFF